MGLPVLGQGDGAGAAGGKGGSQAGRGAMHVQCSQLLSPSLSPSQSPALHQARCSSGGDTEWGSPASALPRKQLSPPQPQGIWDPPA